MQVRYFVIALEKKHNINILYFIMNYVHSKTIRARISYTWLQILVIKIYLFDMWMSIIIFLLSLLTKNFSKCYMHRECKCHASARS